MDELFPDLGTVWLAEGLTDSTIVFDHFDLLMIGRAGPGDYTSTRNLAMDDEYAITFEFDEERFKELLRLLPRAGAKQLAELLGGPFVGPQVVNIPPRAVVVGMRARLGEPRVSPDETYVPLAVTSFFAAGDSMSISFE